MEQPARVLSRAVSGNTVARKRLRMEEGYVLHI
jgi:hypothetical protein